MAIVVELSVALGLIVILLVEVSLERASACAAIAAAYLAIAGLRAGIAVEAAEPLLALDITASLAVSS